VVPKTSETTAKSWPVTAFTKLDFPALRRPKKPMCTRLAAGASFSPMLSPGLRCKDNLRYLNPLEDKIKELIKASSQMSHG
jgi:hypothetical protein